MRPSEADRRAKLERIRGNGHEPYPRSFTGRTKIGAIRAENDPGAMAAGGAGESFRIAGRVTRRRSHRTVVFWDVQDQSGSIEVYVRLEDLGEDAYRQAKEFHIGDMVGIDGSLTATDRGDLAIQASRCVLLAKALRDPPDFVHGLGDPETRYRHRELDMMVSAKSRETFTLRSKLLTEIRSYMRERDFVEVETPILQPLFGGATARPFETHHNALDRRLYLRIATELYLKRAVIGGLENVFELGRIFRNEGISTEHNPEFTMLEMMVGGADCAKLMDFAEDLVSSLVHSVCGAYEVAYRGRTIDFSPPWPRVRLRDALSEAMDLDIATCSCEDLAYRLGTDDDSELDWTSLVEKAQARFIEPNLSNPTFLMELPIRSWPLNRSCLEHPDLLGEVFEVIIGGMEVLSGGAEINDPHEQRSRFIAQREESDPRGDVEPHPFDDEYVEALEYGLPPVGGCGLGVDRLMMILTDSRSLRDVVLFPTMRSA
jgi:lysyl-tRNA synthetase, class II